MTTFKKITAEFRKHTNKSRAKTNAWFFKTGKGEYGEGDKFLGLTVPEQRKIAKKFAAVLGLKEIERLLRSPYHEYRLTALFMLVLRYQKKLGAQKTIYQIFIRNAAYINNWDLVDSSAPYILGDYLYRRDKKVLYRFAHARNLWKKRIAMLATYGFIKNNEFEDALAIAKILLADAHDLIHKAVGWMLREIGNRNQQVEEAFLKKFCKKIPRTALRYALEKFPQQKREAYLKRNM
ncbi:MAG: DNA alkylation repair protein [Candidatus Kerfeldbacteria bacterium RIFCSPHIGHO2_02_FULL_42_14]|uniref:DNA alkylation repair protein n=1 Tax=Candidatus Kerfeldbacteria bacterium RIFCSPHIGHO2_02_FULL_42_14 TaxID=1798540 RepID=A0A1G2AQ35_9BACT|nr:MAG: DNA alkylation repair protein [Candidatus Kerfeldbacteria bacterium RIFCSPHIGHO2_02_FULL_42_14]OGY80812.1 MAG: DNA alkylation repair protein [Candidatus Kerfeldbacteria bacterium RIFCSPHIGHO2_12_FULL_42_13]OGY84983.1 MAG: DNA alkylation repair protein [Candidatus Kerfeldbacteria bacterium RIFCSPLOWO2_02_FULL_42_19]OGY86150.1 MAG: DNA alkylation repair protein [Candidatus Kerfeldbacteria bacterium RIFCSPLOWO2_12_FULL_43_9]